jgi:hypothetical protein
MRNDFKNRRKLLTTVTDINVAKEKFGRKRPRDVREVEVETIKKRQLEVGRSVCN